MFTNKMNALKTTMITMTSYSDLLTRGGARGGLGGAIAPPGLAIAPPRK